MAGFGKTLEIRTSPHLLSGYSVDTIMFNVVLALVPTTAFAIYAFGLAALLTLTVAVGSCLLTEQLACRIGGRPTTLGDWSVAITGLLYGLTLPPGLPLWMTAVGGVVAVGLGKALFGGLGANPFNPALVGRAFLQAAFPVALTTWHPAFLADRFTTLPSSTLTWPFSAPAYDGVTSATPLARWKFEGLATEPADLMFGFVSGSTGETAALLILLGGIYLAARNMMSWRIPTAIFVTVAAASGALHLAAPERYASPVFMLFSGGLMLGAVFMATDMVASPLTPWGTWIYGVLIGLLVVVIRTWGGMPEGVMYAILLGNAVAPHLDRLVRPRVYGTRGGTLVNAGPLHVTQAARPGPWPMYRAMVGVGLLCGLLIVTVFQVTRPRIERNKAEALQRAIFEVLPGAATSRTFVRADGGGFSAVDTAGGDGTADVVYAGYDDAGRLVGLAIEAQGMGYQDVIRLLYGYSFDDEAIIGMKVLESKETPGLGDKIITDDEFLANFERLDVTLVAGDAGLVNAIVAVKNGAKNDPWQIDGITGATISSVAIAAILDKSAGNRLSVFRDRRGDFEEAGP